MLLPKYYTSDKAKLVVRLSNKEKSYCISRIQTAKKYETDDR